MSKDAKLRLLKERKASGGSPVDLRGLGEEEVFKDSKPYAFLAIHSAEGISPTDEMNTVIEKYALRTLELGANEFCLLHKQHESLMHKSQALILFFAGLEIVRQNPGYKTYLGEHSQLHERLHQSLSTHTRAQDKHTLHARVHEWLEKNTERASLAIGEASSYHLHQAGIDGIKPGEFQAWTRGQCERAVEALQRGEVETHSSKRKVG